MKISEIFIQIINTMSIKIVAAMFYLMSVVLPICVNPSQPLGKCTECGPLYVLINGFCFAKIRGCLRHDAGPICLQCQFGYILNGTNCTREAIFFNKTDIKNIPPVKIEMQSALTFSEIKNLLGELYGNYFSQAHDYFINKYSNQLGKGLIQNVQKLQTKRGVFFIIQYLGDSQKQYHAVAFVDMVDTVEEWSFELSILPKKNPIIANTNIRAALGDKLNNYFIYNFKQNGDIYTIDYMNQKLDNLRVILNKNDLISGNLASKLSVNTFNLSNLAFEQLVKQYPEYVNNIVTDFKKYDKYYVLSIGLSVSVSFKFDNYVFSFNKPIFVPPPSPPVSSGQGLLGGFTIFTAYTDPRFSNCIQFIAKQFPELIGSQVTKVESQVVAGLVFFINLRKPIANSTTAFDQYQLKIWFNLSSAYQILQARKNDQWIFNPNFNYNQDPIFFKAYSVASTSSNVANIPPINSVAYKLLGNKRLYKVIYSPTQYSQFEYLTDTNATNLLSYVVDGENILKTLTSAKTSAQTRSSDVLLNFLKSNTNNTLARIQQIQINNTIYTVTLVRNDGTYTAIIQDNGVLSLKQLTKISNISCYDMSDDEIQTNQIIRTMDNFLRNNYPLTGFNIQLIQLNINISNIIYRFLYANSKLKQIQIYMLQSDNNANIIKAAYINNAFQVVDPISTNPDYQKILNILKNTAIAGNKTPFFTQSNSSIVNSYYDDGKSTSQIVYDKASDKSAFTVINTRSYLLVPDGFSLSTILIPGTPSDTQSANLAKLTQEAIKKYSIILANSNLTFADKVNNTYILMFKNSMGYQRLDATIDDKGVVTIGRLIITGYKEGDFSNCRKFGTTGKCLSCDANSQVQYQGNCWKRLQGCLVQPGNICVRCNADFAKSGQRCFAQCSNFFN